MKVVCDGCQAKYQVPDERVAGRKLRIKCRRCGDAIIVRGDRVAVSTPPPPPQGDEWHVSFEDLEHGPMDHGQLMKWLGMRGDRWDAYVWREGMDDWLAARDVTELTSELSGAVPGSEDDSPTQMVQSGFVVNPPAQPDVRASHTADPFRDSAYPPVASDRPPAGAPEPPVSQPPATYPSTPPAYPSSPSGGSSPRVSAEQALTGTRNEESVLFSTSRLRQVAASSSANLALGADPVKARKGMATGEGSGLIDIAALASLSAPAQVTALAGAGDSGPPQPSTDLGHTPMVGTVQQLAPREETSSGLMPVAIFAGALVVAAGVFMGIVMTQSPPTPPAVAAAAAVPEAAAAAVPAPAPATAPAAAEEPAPSASPPTDDGAKAEGAPAEGASPEEKAVATAEPAAKKPSAARAAAAGAAKPKARAPKKAVLAKAAPQKKAAAAGIDDLLAPKKEQPEEPKEEPKKEEPEERTGPSVDDILSGKPAAKEEPKSIDDLLAGATAPEAKGLPASPSRDAVIAAMKGVTSAVRRCGKEHQVTGVAKAAISVDGDSGRVSSADVTGVDGPAVGCISSAVKKARFPKFSKPTFKVNYPFKLN